MLDRVGDAYDGVITGVTNFGLFVQIRELMVDGLVHVTNLPNDYYHHDTGRQRMVGERTGRTFSLGEAMRVLVQRVDMERRRIDFRPAELPHEERPPRRREH
jgi:ribonuclease R